MMVDFVFDQLEEKGVVFFSPAEMEAAQAGIRLWLMGNGVSEDDNRDYFRHYLKRILGRIAPMDLKAYFIHYPAISLVRQIRIEQDHAGGILPPERAGQLWEALTELHRAGVAERYVPDAADTNEREGF